MKARLLRKDKMEELFKGIGDDLEAYRTGDFRHLVQDYSAYIETKHDIDQELLGKVNCTKEDHKEVQNCILLHKAMNGLTPYLARDARLWVYLVLTSLLDYARNRWPIPDDDNKAVDHIKKHFFAAGGMRGIERDNAASRLWWMASLCSRVEGLTLEQSLQSLLHQYDVRANILERPTVSQSIPIFSAILRKLHASYQDDQKLFERQVFRDFMKELNLKGGVKLLEALEEKDLDKVMDECVEEALANNQKKD